MCLVYQVKTSCFFSTHHLSEIKSNKKSVRENEKLSNTSLKPDKHPKDQGTIISFKPKQDESNYPQFVPGLFDDEDDQS